MTVGMFGQTKEGWKALEHQKKDRTVVLRTDCDTLESVRMAERIKLRLICEQGSSMLLHLEQKGNGAERYDDGYLLITLMVPKAKLLECLEDRLGIIFWNHERREGVAFSVKGISGNAWLGEMKPMCEPPQ